MVCLAALLAGCGDAGVAPKTVSTGDPVGRVIHVPAEAPTIQAGVDAAKSGDLVLVSPGIYRESVKVAEHHPPFVLRGLDRNRVILDGGFTRVNGIAVETNGVAVENLTVRRYAINGLLFSAPSRYKGTEPLVGYRAAYVTAANNGLYGIYALSARGGVIEHSYASGSPDSGIYIGQCSPCDAVVSESIAEWNMVGYENTNAGGNIAIVRSVWRHNRVGVAINSQNREFLAPQRGGLSLVGNDVSNNANRHAPKGGEAFGIGIVVSGGRENLITRNLVRGNTVTGIVVSPSVDGFPPLQNVVQGNAVGGSAADLALDSAGSGACFSGNRFASSFPPEIESALACPNQRTVTTRALSKPPAPPQVNFRRVRAPPAQPNMPDAGSAAARIPSPTPPAIDLAQVALPKAGG